MRQCEVTAVSSYDDMPFHVVLFRYLWPFWLLRDASRGDRLARAAAYRHNRMMRVHLPSYVAKWTFNSLLALAATAACDSLRVYSGATDAFSWIAALMGIAFACSLCVTFVIGYIYLYLDRPEP